MKKLLSQLEADVLMHGSAFMEKNAEPIHQYEFFINSSGNYELLDRQTGDSLTGTLNWDRLLRLINEEG